MKGVLNHLRNRIKEIRKNQPNRQSGETFRIMQALATKLKKNKKILIIF
jgi:hypothetical protein